MSFGDEIHDAFAVPNLWRPSKFTDAADPGDDVENGLFHLPELDVTSIKLANPYAPLVNQLESCDLPSLDSFHYGPVKTSELPDVSVLSTDVSVLQDEDEDEEDIWESALKLPEKTNKFLTWEVFQGQMKDIGTTSAYMSEWGPGAFDIALRWMSKLISKRTPSKAVAKRDVAIRAFWDLGLGRESLFFCFAEKSRTFVPTLDRFMVTGYSFAVCESLFKDLSTNGATIRRLRHFAERTYAANAFPGRVALAKAILVILGSLEMHLGSSWRETRSILQVQNAFERPRILISHLRQLIKSVGSCRTDEKLSSAVFDHCQSIEDGEDWLRAIMFEILSIVSRPLLDRIGDWTGISSDPSTAWNPPFRELAFIRYDSSDDGDQASEFVAHLLPVFISADIGMSLYDTGHSLQLLKIHHPNHPLVYMNSRSQAKLEWAFEWPDVDLVAEKARKYENELKSVISNLSIQEYDKFEEATSILEDDLEVHLLKSVQDMDQLPSPNSTTEKLDHLIHNALEQFQTFSDISFFPPLSLVPSLSFTPLLNVQSSFIRTAVLKLLLDQHDLRHHLTILRQFFLFGDGLLVSRLSTALFDVEVSTTERKLGKMRGAAAGMGMRVGFRDTWPPASSEVRLALMGLLSDCFRNNKLLKSETAKGDVLPGNLSFSIRTDCEEVVLDPHNLHALDFLKLSYTPKSPLHEVLSDKTMAMYDGIFKFLLRVVRAMFVVSRLPRSISRSKMSKKTKTDIEWMRLSMHARHVIGVLAAHLFDNVISGSWKAFEYKLDVLENRLYKDSKAGAKETVCPMDLPSLRILHESTLDDMRRGCYLDHRHKHVREELEAVLSTVLEAEKLGFELEMAGGTQIENRICDLANHLESRIKTFLIACRDTMSKGKTNGVEELIRGCDWNGAYGVWTDE